MSDPLVETENPNDSAVRNPGDPTESWDADGTPANTPLLVVDPPAVNPVPDTTQSDPAHVPSPYQPDADLEVLKENARLKEEALQAENRFVRKVKEPGSVIDPTPRVDPEPVPKEPVWDANAQVWR